MKNFIFIILVLTIFSGIIVAAPPAPWVSIIPKYNDSVPLKLPNSQKSPGNFSAPIGQYVSPSSGTNNILVIRVQFQTEVPDNGSTSGTGAMSHPEISYCQTFMSGVNDYYYSASNHSLSLNFTVSTSIYTLANQMNYYGNNDQTGMNSINLIHDALAAADVDYNYNNYSSIMVFHAGKGKESTGSTGMTYDIWSMRSSMTNIYTGDGKQIDSGIIVPEEEYQASALGVICHEYGHELGLPDLYDTKSSTTTNGVGDFALMCNGPWKGNPAGSAPTQMIAWSKIYLNWIIPTEITVSNNYTVKAWSETTTPDILKLPISATEYFLVENRQESSIPANGILILHIDDTAGTFQDNNVQNSYPQRVHIEQADGNNDIDNKTNQGDQYDTYYSGNSQSSGSFNDTSNPNSKDYSTSSTDVDITSFPASSSSMTITVNVSNAGTPVSNPVINYPQDQTAVKGNDQISVSGSGTANCIVFSRRLLDENNTDITSSTDWSGLVYNSTTGAFSGTVKLPVGFTANSIKIEIILRNSSSISSIDTLSRSNSLNVDIISPDNGTIIINNNDSQTSTQAITLNISTNGASQMWIDGDVIDDVNTKEWVTYNSLQSVNLIDLDGLRQVNVKFRDGAFNESTPVSDTITLDRQGPVNVSVSIDEASPIGNYTIHLTLYAENATEMYIDGDVVDDSNTKQWLTYATTLVVNLSSGDGTKTITAKFRDSAQNESVQVNDTILLDTNSPTDPQISIDEGEYTNNNSINLTLSAVNATEMWIDGNVKSGTNIRTWIPYTNSATAVLTDYDGTKTVSAKFRNLSHSESATVTDSIIFDTTAPTGLTVTSREGSDVNHQNIFIDIHSDDTAELYIDGDVKDAANIRTWIADSDSEEVNLTDSEGSKTISVKFRDLAGNESSDVDLVVNYDKTAPTNATISIVEGDSTITTAIHISISADNADEMYISGDVQDNETTFEWINYVNYKEVYLTTGDGNKTVKIKFRDKAHNETIDVNDIILLDSEAPSDPSNFTATAKDTKVELSWTNANDNDFSGTKILRKLTATFNGYNDGSAEIIYNSIGNGKGTVNTYLDEGLTNEVTYYYKAFSYDNADHYSSGVLRSAMPHEVIPVNIISVDSYYGVSSDEDYPIGATIEIEVVEEHLQIVPDGGTVQIVNPDVGYNPSGAKFDLESNGAGKYYYTWSTIGLKPGNYQVRTTLGDDLDGVPSDPDLLIKLNDTTAPEIESLTSNAGNNYSGIYPLGATITFKMKEKFGEENLNAQMEIRSLSRGIVGNFIMTNVSSGIYIYNWDTSTLDETYVLNDYKVNGTLIDDYSNTDAKVDLNSFEISDPAPPDITEVKSAVGTDTDNIYHKNELVKIIVVEANQTQGLDGTVEIQLQGSSTKREKTLIWDNDNNWYYVNWDTSIESTGIYEIESTLRNNEMLREDSNGSNSTGVDLLIKITDDLVYPQTLTYNPQGSSVATNSTINIMFSEEMWPEKCENAFSLKTIPSNETVTGVFSWNNDTKEMIFTPDISLKSHTTYQALLTRDAKDPASNQIINELQWQFITKIIQTEGQGEIIPRIAEPNSEVEYSYKVKPVIEENAAVIKKIDINIPYTHTYIDVTGITPTGTYSYAANKLEVVFNNAIAFNDNTTIEVKFKTKAPLAVDAPDGVKFSSIIINEIGESFNVVEEKENSLNVLTAQMINSVVGEFNPRYARPNRVNLPVEYSVSAVINSNNAGYDILKIKAPASYPIISTGDELTINVNNKVLTYNADIDNLGENDFFAISTGTEIKVYLGKLITNSYIPFKVGFSVNTPDVPGDVESGGEVFLSELGNSLFTTFFVLTEADKGDADNNSENSNDIKIETGFAVSGFAGELTPNIVKANITDQEYIMNLRAVIGTRYIGFDYFRIDCATDHVLDQLKTAEFFNNSTLIKTYQISSSFTKDENKIYPYFSGGTAELRFGDIVDKDMLMTYPNGYFKLVFNGQTPSHGDSGSDFIVKVDNYVAKTPMQAAASDVNNDLLGASFNVKTVAPCNSAYGEIVPAYIKPLSENKFDYYFELDIDPTVNTGVDRIIINTGSVLVLNVSGVYLNGILDSSFVFSNTNNSIDIRRSSPIKANAVLKVIFYAKAGVNENYGEEFTSTVDNYSTENPITVLGGKNIDGVSDNSENIIVQTAYPATAVLAELKPSEEIVGTINGVPSEKQIEYTYVLRPSFSGANIGIDEIFINIPNPHSNISILDSEFYVNNEKYTIKPSPSSGEVYLNVDTATDGSGTIEVTLGKKIIVNTPIKLTFKAITPAVEPGGSLTSTFNSWVDNSKANMRMQAVSGNSDSTIHGIDHSIDVITLSVPVNSITATFSPNPTYIRERPLYTLQLFPIFKASDSGIDTVKIELPRTMSNTEISSVYVNETLQSNVNIVNGSYEITITGIQRTSYSFPGTITIKFYSQNPEFSLYQSIISVVVDDSTLNRGVRVPPIHFDIKGPITSGTASITPNEFETSITADISSNIDLNITSNDTGVDIVEMIFPNDIQNINSVKVVKDGLYQMPGSNIDLNISSSEIKIQFNNHIYSNTNIKVDLKCDMPANAFDGTVEVKVSDKNNEMLFSYLKPESSGKLEISTLKHSIKEVDAKAVDLSYLGWNVELKIIFETRMNAYYGSVYVDNVYEAVNSNFYNTEINGRETAVWEGKIFIPYAKMGQGKFSLEFRNGKDIKGNIVETLYKDIDITAGTAIFAFYDPILQSGAKSAVLVLTAYTSEESVSSVKVKAYEDSKETEIILSKMDHYNVYKGSYKLTKDGHPKIKPITVDTNGKTNEGVEYLISTRVLSPEKATIDYNNYTFNIASNSIDSNNIMVVYPVKYLKDQGELIPQGNSVGFAPHDIKFRKDIELKYHLKLTNKQLSSSLKDKRIGLYQLNNNKWNYLCSIQKAVSENIKFKYGGIIGAFKDETKPKIKYLSPEIIKNNENIEFEITDKGSGIKNIILKADNNILEYKYEDGIYRFLDDLENGEHSYVLSVNDNSGNSAEMKGILRVITNINLANVSVYPDPAIDEITFKYSSNADNVIIDIYDVYGDKVNSLDGSTNGKDNEIYWDMTNEKNNKIANGVYFYKIKAWKNGECYEENGKFAKLE